MTFDLANIVGLLGSTVTIIAYAYSNMAKAMNFIIFNLLNLAGALLLIWSLTVHFNLASMVMEIAWTAIALLGLYNSIKRKTP
ncbi:CBU_0592 family membrane protein [Sphingobium olei]|uniref:CBU-0592-like domain-containing protein n=1 Tax=Sphingobium olei TaxID=420955 RepID=A0ABW3NY83_9SPHN|nr:hypothetical protein [Sphingobium sp.]